MRVVEEIEGSLRAGAEPEPAYLSVREAAALLRVDVKTVHKALAAGELPHLRLGRVIRIPRTMLRSACKSA